MKRILLCIVFLLLPLAAFATAYPLENNFLVISDIHLDIYSKHPMEISPSKENDNNDLDKATFIKLISEISDNIKNGIIKKPKFIVVLGDIVGHVRTTSESTVENEALVFNVLKQGFIGIPIFYTVGNNDSLKVNYGPFRDEARSGSAKSAYDVAKTYAGWESGFLSTGVQCGNLKFPCLITENNQYGTYAAYLQPKFRLIALNSVMFSPRRQFVTEEEAFHQLQWFNEQLRIATANKESVLITMHIPPGNNVYDHSNFWLPNEQQEFLRIIKEYSHTIVGILASHSHADELKVIKDGLSKNISGVYFTAGLSTSHGNEPSAKTFYFSHPRDKWQLANYETFHFSKPQDNLIFSKLYDYVNYYCENSKEGNLSNCLDNITAQKMQNYFSAGNVNFKGTIGSPSDIVLMG